MEDESREEQKHETNLPQSWALYFGFKPIHLWSHSVDIRYMQDTEQVTGRRRKCISERDRLRHKSPWFKADSNQLFSWSLRLFVFEVIHLGLLFPAFCYKHNVLSFETLVGMFQWVGSEKTSGVETLSLPYSLTVAARTMSMTTFYLFLFLKIYFNSF